MNFLFNKSLFTAYFLLTSSLKYEDQNSAIETCEGGKVGVVYDSVSGDASKIDRRTQEKAFEASVKVSFSRFFCVLVSVVV